MSTLNAAVGLPGAHETLRAIDQSSDSVFTYDALADLMGRHGAEDVDKTLTALIGSNLLHQAPQGFEITHLGRRAGLLLDALNGADLRDVWRGLGYLDPTLRNYELLRNNLTDEFLKSLTSRPSFGRLYICSPWISFDRREEKLLASAMLQAERGGVRPDIWVVTRPEKGPTEATAPSGGRYLQQLGATVVLNRNLHSKLYIREPGPSGGYLMAILGSQNLTRSTYLELGIRIHADTIMISNLIAYFLELMSQSDEVS